MSIKNELRSMFQHFAHIFAVTNGHDDPAAYVEKATAHYDATPLPAELDLPPPVRAVDPPIEADPPTTQDPSPPVEKPAPDSTPVADEAPKEG